MVAVIQKKAFKPGTYKGKVLSAARLRQFAEGTNKALAAGVPIPALEKHAKPAANDKETEEFVATAGAGWLTKLDVEDDGSLTPHFDVPERIAAGIKEGAIKFTSPEFRDAYKAADGRFEGSLTRHWAFTPLPKAHDQGQLAIAMSEGVYQFAEDDYEGPPKGEKDGEGDGEKQKAEEPPEKNPDIPTTATDETKLQAIRACLSQLGAELASDWDWANPGGPDQLLACLKTLGKAKQEAEANESEPEEPETKEADATGSSLFSEDDMAGMTPSQQAKAKKANEAALAAHAQALQFSEERLASAKQKAFLDVKATKIPPGLKTKLLDLLSSAQFSEGGEQPTLTIVNVADLVATSLPPEMAFAEDDGTETDHPDGQAFFKANGGKETPEEAEAIVNEMFTRHKQAG